MRTSFRLVLLSLVLALAPVGQALAAPPAEGSSTENPQAKRITGSKAYVPTFGLTASITKGNRIQGTLSVDAGLDVPEADARKRVQALMPRITSEMRNAVLNYASISYTSGERPDADMLRLRLQRAVDGVLGAGKARVTLASVMVFRR
jgi:hypothetical protein